MISKFSLSKKNNNQVSRSKVKPIVKCLQKERNFYKYLLFIFLDCATEQQEMDDHSHRYEGQSAQPNCNHYSYLPLNNGDSGDYSCQQLDHFKQNKGTHNEHADRSAKTGENIVTSKPAFVKEEITLDENADWTVNGCNIIVGQPELFVKQESTPIEHIDENVFMYENSFGQSDVFVKKEIVNNEHAASLCTVSMCQNYNEQPAVYIKKEIADSEQVTGTVSITQSGVGQLDVVVKQENSDYEHSERIMNIGQDNVRQQDEHANRKLFICEDSKEQPHNLMRMEITHNDHTDKIKNTCEKMIGHPELHKEKYTDTGINIFKQDLDDYSKEELHSLLMHNRKHAAEIQLEGQSVFEHSYAQKTPQEVDHSFAQQCVTGTMYTSQQHNINKVTKLNFTHNEHPYSKVFVRKDVKKSTDAVTEEEKPHNEHVTEIVTTRDNNKGHPEQQEGKNTGVIFFKWSNYRRQGLISYVSYKRKLAGEEQQQVVDPSYEQQISNHECGKGTVNMCQDSVGLKGNLEELDNTHSEHAKGEVFTCEDNNIEWRTEAEFLEQVNSFNEHATETVITSEKGEGYFEWHKGKSTEITIFKCNLCNFSTYWWSSRAIYKRKPTEEKQIEDQQHVDHLYAGQKGNDGTELNREMQNHRHLGEFSCKQIPIDQLGMFRFRKMNNERVHVTVFISENGELPVAFVRKDTKNNEYTEGVSYASVMGEEQTEGPLLCDTCKFRTPCSTRLKLHMRMHKKQVYLCDVCDYSTHKVFYLKEHKRKHTGIKCDVCGYSTHKISDLNVHKRIHTEEKSLKCHSCDFSTNWTASLKKHKRIHSKEKSSEKLYNCDECGYFTHKITRLNIHKRIHTGEKPIKCNLCDFSTNWMASLTKHKIIHSEEKSSEKPYKCDVCSYSTVNSSQLDIHKRKHTGVKPLKCNLCDFSTNWMGSLKIHKTIHSKDKPYKCYLCDYRSNNFGFLKLHKKIHEKQIQYKCDPCGFHTHSYLQIQAHRAKHRGDHKCDLCEYRTT